MTFTCIKCLSDTDNDCDVCDECAAEHLEDDAPQPVDAAPTAPEPEKLRCEMCAGSKWKDACPECDGTGWYTPDPTPSTAITGEPVAWRWQSEDGAWHIEIAPPDADDDIEAFPLYATPPAAAPDPEPCGPLVCEAARTDGVICADDECDRVNGVRPAAAPDQVKHCNVCKMDTPHDRADDNGLCQVCVKQCDDWIASLSESPDQGVREVIERCAKIADEYAAPTRFKVHDCWKDDQSPSEVYETAANDVGMWIANEIRSLSRPAPDAAGSELPIPLIGAIVAALGQRVRLMHDNGKDQAREDLDSFKKWADAREVVSRQDREARTMADRKTVLLLKMIAAAGGSIDATDSHGQMLNYFCDDRGRGDDTFNLAIKAKLIHTTFHDIFETSTAYLTDAGRAAMTGKSQGDAA